MKLKVCLRLSAFIFCGFCVFLFNASKTFGAELIWGADFSNTTAQNDCYIAVPDGQKSRSDRSFYIFWDHIVISSTLTKSRCIVLKNVPYSGYYQAKVTALYSPVGTPYHDKEQYRLCIQLPDTLIRGPIIPDQNSEKTTGKKITGVKTKYDYYEIDHGLVYLLKGDNTIWFEAGNQAGLGPSNSNGMDFEAIALFFKRPTMVIEPPFTAGNSNTVEYRPVFTDAYYQEVICFDKSAPSLQKPQARSLRKAVPDSIKSAVFNGLEHGHMYGYYIETYMTPDQVTYSDTTYSTQDALPPGKVVIDPMSSIANRRAYLYWYGVEDEVSGVKEYRVVRMIKGSGSLDEVTAVVIPAIAGCGKGCQYEWVDEIPNPNLTYQYRIDALDRAGNRSTGEISELVVGVPAPKVQVLSEAVGRLHKGPCVIVGADISQLKLPESHMVRFEIARDQTKFLDDRWKPNTFFFESGWLQITSKSERPKFVFDLTGGGRSSLTFIDGHRYYIRAQYKDLQENHSEWSMPDTLWIVPDCFPPNDIRWLTVTSVKNSNNTEGWMDLRWGEAQDLTSGVKEYVIYRKIPNIETDFKEITRTRTTQYKDSFVEIDYNGDVLYRIGSVDGVGNARKESAFVAGERSMAAPPVAVSYERMIDGKLYTTSAVENFTVDLRRFQFDGTILKIVLEYNGVEYDWPEAVREGFNVYPVTIPADGFLELRAKVVYKNKTESLWSSKITIYRVKQLPNNDRQNKILAAALNFPNPFNPATQITFDLQEDAEVTVEVFNIQGKRIKTLLNGYERQGRISTIWNGTDENGVPTASGLYFYCITIKSDRQPVRKMMNSMLLVK